MDALNAPCIDDCQHNWHTIGENTASYVLWCSNCGGIHTDGERDYEFPLLYWKERTKKLNGTKI